MGAAASTVEMRRLEAPARHKPHIDQHQRRALRRPIAETAGYIQKRSAAGPLHGRYSGRLNRSSGDRRGFTVPIL